MDQSKEVRDLIRAALRCKQLCMISWEAMANSRAIPALFDALRPFEVAGPTVGGTQVPGRKSDLIGDGMK